MTHSVIPWSYRSGKGMFGEPEKWITDGHGYIIAELLEETPDEDGFMMAAADDLLFACEALIELIDIAHLDSVDTDPYVIAKEAIAKAKGER